MPPIRFAILIVSDTCASGEKVDESGAALKAFISNTHSAEKLLEGDISYTAIVQEDEASVMEHLISWSDENKVDVILTIGGTGFTKRDVTPEATKKVIHKETIGLSTAMMISSLKITPLAMLSRAVCGIRNNTLIINLPGSTKAAIECLTAIAPAIPHAVDLILDNKAKIKDTHNIAQHDHVTSGLPDSSVNLNFRSVTTYRIHSPMISVEKAVEIIRRSVGDKDIETEYVKDAYGRILSENIYAKCNLPPFRASIIDGYAVLASDGKARRKVLDSVDAGTAPNLMSLQPGTCVYVTTGASIPDEATAVVQIEDTILIENFEEAEELEADEIELINVPEEGQNIRPIGCDIEEGSLVLVSHTNIGPVEIGLLVGCGCHCHQFVSVYKLPSIGILSIGDELQEVGQPLSPGHVYDSNKTTLILLLKESGFHSLDFGIVVDDSMDMIDKIREALEKVDVLVITGSLSMGDINLLKYGLETYFNATIHFGLVNMKPGEPTTFATCTILGKKKYFLCLPGNLVSATVTARLFLLPLLNEMCGDSSEPVIVQAKLMSLYKLDPCPEYAMVILKWCGKEAFARAYSTENQISSMLLNCKNANALLMLPGRTVDKQVLNKGDIVSAMLIGFK